MRTPKPPPKTIRVSRSKLLALLAAAEHFADSWHPETRKAVLRLCRELRPKGA